LRALIREMSRPNPLWGAPRIHGEVLNPNRRWLSLPRTKSGNIGDDAHEDRARDKLADPLDRSMSRGILAQRQVRSVPVVVGSIGFEDSAQMVFAQDHHVVQALPTDGADQPLGMAVLPR